MHSTHQPKSLKEAANAILDLLVRARIESGSPTGTEPRLDKASREKQSRGPLFTLNITRLFVNLGPGPSSPSVRLNGMLFTGEKY